MGILARAVFREVVTSAALGTVLFTFVLFLQKVGRLMEVLVRGSVPASTVASLLLLLLPPVLILSLPIGTLVGVLIGLGRMASDGEITAMRAAGVPSRRVVAPVIFFSFLAMGLAAACSLWLTPKALQYSQRLASRSVVQQLTAAIQPRVFEEQFAASNRVIYVGDVIPSASSIAEWRKVFIADVTSGESRSTEGRRLADVPKITIASAALAVPDAAANTIQLSMTDLTTHEVEEDPAKYHITAAPRGDQLLRANMARHESQTGFPLMDTRPLFAAAANSAEAAVELHQRFALPVACVLLGILGIPLGVSSRKGGKPAAFVITVFVAFLYYMGLVSLIGVAKQGRIGVELAVWAPNAIFSLLGIALLWGLERPGDRDVLSRARSLWSGTLAWLKGKLPVAGRTASLWDRLPSLPLTPRVVDTYVLSSFLFYFGVLLGSLVLFAHVYIFLELLGDVFQRNIAMSEVFRYHFFLTPMLVYESAPMSVLVAVLVTFGILSKNNEVTAMKACGVSLYRLALPILVTGMGISGALFAFDHYYIPKANRIQDGILDKIKGRPTQTYLRPDRKWIFGQGSRIFYYKHLDSAENVMVGVNVYELDPQSFQLTRYVHAESARWEPGIGTWIFQGGWVREFSGARPVSFRKFQASTFPDIGETPGHFLRTVQQESQLNFRELDTYIRDLQQSGFDTVRLRVQFHKKFSVPMFAVVMALLSVPFAFLAGTRGAMAGVGAGLGIAIAYYAVGRLFLEIGNVNQLPAVLAAWSPNALFAMAGMYLFTRMRT